MIKVEVKNIAGEKVEDLELRQEVFGLELNHDLIHQAYITQASNQREAIAHTKTRGERAGSGKKPWKQKGTGRARVGQVRNPVWRKGGVAFGPRNDRNFSKKINKKMNQLAIKMVLSGKLADQEMVVLDKYELANPKTKEMAKAISNLKIKGKILMAFAKADKDKMLTSRNLPKVENIFVENLNVFDMLNNKYLVISKESVKFLEEKYSQKAEAKSNE